MQTEAHPATAAALDAKQRPAGGAERVLVAAAEPPERRELHTQEEVDRVLERNVEDFLKGYRSLYEEFDFDVTDDMVEGRIPPELTGTLFRNGPGLLDIFGRRLNQPFDGDAMISAFAFRNGRAHYRNRYVRTKGFVDEQAAERMLYKGAFATGNPSGGWFFNPFDFTVKNVANTGVLHWAGRLYALHESGLAHEMDPATLQTFGETNLGGVVSGKGPFAAHYRIVHEDDGSQRWVTFGASVGGNDATVSLYEFDSEPNSRAESSAAAAPSTSTATTSAGGASESGQTGHLSWVPSPAADAASKAALSGKLEKGRNSGASTDGAGAPPAPRLLHKTVHKLPGAAFGFFHDMAVTENYYILFQNPTKISFRKLLLEYMFGRCSIAECIQFDRSLPTRIWLLPRPGRPGAEQRQVQTLETAPFFTFHHANAFETADGRHIVVDTMAWNSLDLGSNMNSLKPEYFRGGQRSTLQRVVLNLVSGEVTRQALSQRTAEFPTLGHHRAGRPHRYVWMPASQFDDPVQWSLNMVLLRTELPPEAGVGAPFDPAAIKTQVWAPGPRKFTGEPIYVPRSGRTDGAPAAEDDAWILLLVFDGETERSELCILDAADITKGPVATIKLPHHIPHGLHGSWTQGHFGALPGLEAAAGNGAGPRVVNVIKGKPQK